MKSMALSLSFAALLGIASAANAQLAFDQTGGVPVIYGDAGTVGYTFDVHTSLMVTELEMYVDFGFQSDTFPVGIWDNSGTLLTSAAISTSAPAATTPSANGGSFFGLPITPVILTPGTYTIGAFGNGSDTIAVGGTIIADPAVTYGNAAFITAGSLTQPHVSALSIATIGPSFKFTAVPEPGTVAFCLSMIATGSVIIRRHRAR